ncbi:MAG: hypothetical protein KatS3mg061_3501 [Dehalococcoidia bacterium]|nr:MAG: hypothetical protein KatS3mg061_3501 [Dehalococcoidia bacterium]
MSSSKRCATPRRCWRSSLAAFGGATYQVPVEIRGDRRISLALRWLIASARARSGKSFAEKLAAELVDAAQGQGATIKKRDDTHRMAEANRAFSHYRW